jgi:hypothetical protein
MRIHRDKWGAPDDKSKQASSCRQVLPIELLSDPRIHSITIVCLILYILLILSNETLRSQRCSFSSVFVCACLRLIGKGDLDGDHLSWRW